MSDIENLDYYQLLGVPRTAALSEIKRAYRREISKYHPDRFAKGTPEQLAYAQLRSQRLTEAYGVLSDLAARTAYNHSRMTATGRDRQPYPSTPPQPPQQRNYQAELYDQAQAHIHEGRLLQAIGVLRQLQQINPFYRDSADLLATIEGRMNRRPEKTARRLPRSLRALAGLAGGVALIALAAWALTGRGSIARRFNGGAGAGAAAVATELPTRPPEPTFSPAQPTAAPGATDTPPTAAPTTAPSIIPPDPPPATAVLVAPTSAPESGPLLLSDRFGGGGWADMSGPGWQVGYRRGRYRISGDAGTGAIWSYRTAPESAISIGVDVQVSTGEGGLLVRFADASRYTSITLNPGETSFRVEQHVGDTINVLAGGQSEAIDAGPDATNRLLARVGPDRLQVLVNGQQLADISGSTPADSARYGLLVIAKDSPSEASFDNLEIRQLDS